MSRICRIAIVLSSLILVLFVGVSLGAKEEQKYELRWGAAVLGGNWATLGSTMLEDVLRAYPSLSGSVMPIGGTANVMGIYQGKLNIAFTKADVVGEAWEGVGDFAARGKVRNLRILASLFPEPSQFLVYADSGITTIPELKGRRITAGPKGGGTEPLTIKVLDAYGMSIKDVQWTPLPFNGGVEQMLDRHLDALAYGAMGYPAPQILNITSVHKTRMLSLSDEVIAKLVKTAKGIEPYTLPANSYKGIDYPVKGISSSVILIVHESMPEDVAYKVTKTIAENFSRYADTVKAMALGKPAEMGKSFGFPHHPGALKYYKEKGWVK